MMRARGKERMHAGEGRRGGAREGELERDVGEGELGYWRRGIICERAALAAPGWLTGGPPPPCFFSPSGCRVGMGTRDPMRRHWDE